MITRSGFNVNTKIPLTGPASLTSSHHDLHLESNVAKWTIWQCETPLFGLKNISITDQILLLLPGLYWKVTQTSPGLHLTISVSLLQQSDGSNHHQDIYLHLISYLASIIDTIPIMSRSWLSPSILLKSGDIWPQLWQVRPSAEPETRLLFIFEAIVENTKDCQQLQRWIGTS